MKLSYLYEIRACSDATKWFEENFGKEAPSSKVFFKVMKDGRPEWFDWYVNETMRTAEAKDLQPIADILKSLLRNALKDRKVKERKLITSIVDQNTYLHPYGNPLWTLFMSSPQGSVSEAIYNVAMKLGRHNGAVYGDAGSLVAGVRALRRCKRSRLISPQKLKKICDLFGEIDEKREKKRRRERRRSSYGLEMS